MNPIDLHIEGTKQGAIENARNRLIVVVGFFTVGFFTIVAKLIAIGVFNAIPATSASNENIENAVIMARADIVDRNGVILATNLKAQNVSVRTKNITDPELLSYKIAEILPEFSREYILGILTSKKHLVPLKRKLSPRQEFELNKLGEPGLEFSDAEKRVYPHGRLFSHILGTVNLDNKGRSGVERFFNEELTDPRLSEKPVQLSVDIRLQYILNKQLKAAVDKFSAIGGAGLILDVNTGEVLAVSSLPDFNPNEPILEEEIQDPKWVNQIFQGVYELGSGFKTFTVASALDHKVVDLADEYDATKPVRIGGYTIHDDHPKNSWLNIPEIFVHSSNIGTLKMAQDLGVDRQKELFKKLGLFEKTNIEVYETVKPLLPEQWGPTELATTSYGHGIAVSPLHLTNGVAAIVNGGKLNRTTLLKTDENASSVVLEDNVISPETSEIMRNLLHLVVKYGTGGNADVDGYLIGGKTGTAIKAARKEDKIKGYRRNALISSFVSVFPIDEPRYAIFAMLDEPKGIKETFNQASGGWTAAPVISEVISQMGPLVGIEPQHVNEVELKDMVLVSE